MSNARFLFGYIFFTILIFSYFYIYGTFAMIGFLIVTTFYSIIIYLSHKLWKNIRGDISLDYKEFFPLFLYKSSLYLCIIVGIIIGFTLYHNELRPAQMPTHTITNGKQTIIFQAMSHIASESFYNTVVLSIFKAKKDDYVLYYEGVLPGSEKNNNDFNNALGINFSTDLYDNFSKIYGVTAQNNSDFLGIVNNLDYNIDISIDEIMKLYNAKINKNKQPHSSFSENTQLMDVNGEIIDTLSRLSNGELKILRYVNQSFLNFMIKSDKLRNFIIEKIANKDIFSIILDERNTHIVDEIYKRNDEKVFIIYGLMHFDGVMQLLQQRDSNWEVVKTSYSEIITRSE